MKKLLLYRHAKSSWDDLFILDRDRPLSERGLRDAPQMAQRLKRRNIYPDGMLSSSAKRAETTALITAENLHFPTNKIELSPKLYHVSAAALLDEIRKTPDEYITLFVFGHNPGLNEAIALLGGEIDNLPTCGQFGFIFEVEEWQKIGPDNARVWFFDYPKKKPT